MSKPRATSAQTTLQRTGTSALPLTTSLFYYLYGSLGLTTSTRESADIADVDEDN